MKYGETVFGLFYLITAITVGMLLLRKARTKTETRMGAAVLILGCGDAFHLVPRVLQYFIAADFTAALGVGKLVTSLTMTVFYVLLYAIGCDLFGGGKKPRHIAVGVLAALRAAVCLLPQNGWLQNESSMLWGALRNAPFTALGAIVIVQFYRERNALRRFRRVWLWVLLSFAFYLPVAVFASLLPLLGMLMLPKTVCYLAICAVFYAAVVKDAPIVCEE